LAPWVETVTEKEIVAGAPAITSRVDGSRHYVENKAR
jgi:hypothetical protein